ncbi:MULTISPECIES: UDP-N-acetylmuramoyl-tripeptide--D-alanyl-D-alanine ligase [unclassified Arthrobacter]|uniref:UDP-N-acetylmuramoyl-tripeptide--D-alanyl-D- alanine ligase n=1 Tax=unclassified Arthrobacter TaxID=235627 RepID=UPI002104B792|nr:MULTISPECIES: UDP-N-acetylmuramoyl-tripeptide--D-alanyl-D-alanine ligase [unclassified Arthrobacter]MCQ1946582.1 UDP-N-acetylmuramoyl-tripeptide--D-alanyl-D-alanine ligase [Arthrobacter sp. zg-Y1116]MCQ1987283.1 UDP-N-acetylmuramoyl-tripeptide--D-alanyl-D-alanine ligase [Arthrobacter sp. zg-Y844]MCQ1995946.1 UDP-N-acetylmuramoyl-tripeptide--D-alanyl-D-alanine ligase [Arthrobacter sp. zg-Y1171]UWX82975.1 UDP-N-acetylmuramoyl-tripeptide--D-alanyl-D-alanine ligase [Arthrobacter sp. zg-Y1171]
MIELNAAEIAAITGGELIGPAAQTPGLVVTSATTDSRDAVQGSLFIAKPGENSDGHLFVGAAFARGAMLALLERPVADDAGALYPGVLVPDAVLAMGTLAAEIVRRLRAHGELTVIGITGSAGKTTTKDLLAGVLTEAGPTVAPVGSYNGEVGLPLTVFTAGYGTRYLVMEMGATRIGNIRYLADMVKPDIGVVLFVGSAHAGEFGGVDNIAVAKGELVEALPAGGTAILNADDIRVAAMAERTDAPVLYFTSSPEAAHGAKNAVRALDARTDAEGRPVFTLLLPDGSRHEIRSGLIGAHHTANLLAAAAAAYAAGIPGEQIAAGLSGRTAASRWRMERTDRADGVTVINDAYNANPESMRAALRTLAELGRERRTWAVLGEMLELGEDAVTEHDAIGRYAVRLNISKLIVVGTGARAMHTGAVMEGSWGEESTFVETAEEAERILAESLAPGDLVLFKSSNGAALRFLGDRIALTPVPPSAATDPATAPARTEGTGGENL